MDAVIIVQLIQARMNTTDAASSFPRSASTKILLPEQHDNLPLNSCFMVRFMLVNSPSHQADSVAPFCNRQFKMKQGSGLLTLPIRTVCSFPHLIMRSRSGILRLDLRMLDCVVIAAMSMQYSATKTSASPPATTNQCASGT